MSFEASKHKNFGIFSIAEIDTDEYEKEVIGIYDIVKYNDAH